MEVLTLVYAVCFFGAAVFGVSPADLVLQLVIGTILLGIYLVLRHDRREQEKFRMWLDANRLQILSDRAFYNHIEIDRHTKFVQFDAAVSFGIFSTRRTSRLFVREVHFTLLQGMLFSLITLMFGWWALPVGPFRSISVLWRNVRGGHKITAQELIG
ncbi:hypothetical protein DNH61_08705 [Paenibacillus sambharensis]|uniref:Uncharacterized protein n=1 Tax=Paenibacillus sambharensis TaxID=1803190 RepID=A0A2W1LDW7_9BACL|nr:hypothetical protein [Paenibacillus sambharensis]PZD96270.1 hypothetical protein DNH61_08705 [Paenibacillus sambharensis]